MIMQPSMFAPQQGAATAPNTNLSAASNSQTGQTGAQPSLFSGFGQQQSQPQSLFGNPGQAQLQQQQQFSTSLLAQPPANQSGGVPSLFGSSTVGAGQPPSTGGTSAFGGAAWNSGNPLLPKSAFGGSINIGPNQNQQQGTGLGTSFFGQQPPQQQGILGSNANQIQQK
jgi:hypothetical protein